MRQCIYISTYILDPNRCSTNFYLYVHIVLQVLRKYFKSHVNFEMVNKAEAIGSSLGDQGHEKPQELGSRKYSETKG